MPYSELSSRNDSQLPTPFTEALCGPRLHRNLLAAGYTVTVRDIIARRFRSAGCLRELDATPAWGSLPIGMLCEALTPPGSGGVIRHASVARHMLAKITSPALGPGQLAYADCSIATIARLLEVLQRPFGHGLVVGPSDCGQAGLLRAAAAVHGGVLHQVRAPASGSLDVFCTAMREPLTDAGASQRPHVIVVHDDPPLTLPMLARLALAMSTGFVEGHIGTFLQTVDIGSALASTAIPSVAAQPPAPAGSRLQAERSLANAVILKTHTLAPRNVHIFLCMDHHQQWQTRLQQLARDFPTVPSLASHIPLQPLGERDIAWVVEQTLEHSLPRDLYRLLLGRYTSGGSDGDNGGEGSGGGGGGSYQACAAATLIASLYIQAQGLLPQQARASFGQSALQECIQLCTELLVRQHARMQVRATA